MKPLRMFIGLNCLAADAAAGLAARLPCVGEWAALGFLLVAVSAGYAAVRLAAPELFKRF